MTRNSIAVPPFGVAFAAVVERNIPAYRQIKATPPKKPRARQIGGKWVIHTGSFNQPFCIGWSLTEAWMYWEQLCAMQGKGGAA